MLFYTLIPGTTGWKWPIAIIIILFFVTGNTFLGWIFLIDATISRFLIICYPKTYETLAHHIDSPWFHIGSFIVFCLCLAWLIISVLNMLNF